MNFVAKICAAVSVGLCVVVSTGCGGSDAGIGAPVSVQARSVLSDAVSAGGSVTFAIGITPLTRPGLIRPKYISPSTQSMRIAADGIEPVVVNLTPSSPNCAANPSAPGSYICKASLSHIPAGNYVFTITTYDLTGGNGNVLSTNTSGTVVVKAVGVTGVSVVLEGMVHDVILTLANTDSPVGTPATIALSAVVEDADQNLIVGAARFTSPITLTTTDPTAGPLTRTLLQSPADLSGIAVRYSGANVTGITYSATAPGLPAANVADAVLTPGATRHLYVVDREGFYPGSVVVFDLRNLATAPNTITGNGISFPWGGAMDALGRLYVASSGSRTSVPQIDIIDTAHGNAALPPITGGGLFWPFGIALDSRGRLYVANQNGTTVGGNVVVFDTQHGNAVLPPIGANEPIGVAVDSSGLLYVVNGTGLFGTGIVAVYDTNNGNATKASVTSPNLLEPYGAAVDASGRLYVTSLQTSTVRVFDTVHGNAELPPITGGGMNGPTSVTLDPSGKLYVTNWTTTISVFDTAHGSAALPPIGGFGEATAVIVH